MEQTMLYDGRMLNHHPKELCKGQVCPLHNPSNHALSHYPQNWREDWGVMTRMVDGKDVVDPDEYKLQHLKPGDTLILQNSAKCKLCGDEIFSTFRWDYVLCSCDNVMVDGGKAYLRHGVSKGWNTYENTSIEYTKE